METVKIAEKYIKSSKQIRKKMNKMGKDVKSRNKGKDKNSRK